MGAGELHDVDKGDVDAGELCGVNEHDLRDVDVAELPLDQSAPSCATSTGDLRVAIRQR